MTISYVEVGGHKGKPPTIECRAPLSPLLHCSLNKLQARGYAYRLRTAAGMPVASTVVAPEGGVAATIKVASGQVRGTVIR